ncbi:hypothetical protein [Clostridium omnivorum]|uniref:Uncharacterized protein n=1 Tax=Clostridium omnivorum TaxID=1604902 RepID=A0ABQ5N7J7_9CLOT|nr:hypothetical protein [Clostridium sp. E14]GLC31213.1 hypothetical protein bsdE14_26230 [Clostridium sp. E14]
MNDYSINKIDTERISNKLKLILEKEIQAGNEILETWKGWPYDSTVISLRYPFKVKLEKLPDNITFKELNDIHYWKAEYHDLLTNDLLICKFGKPV